MKHLLLSASAVVLGTLSIAADSTVDIVIKDMIANTEVNGNKLNPNQNYLNFNNWEYLGFKFDVEFEGTNKPGYNKAGYYNVLSGSTLKVTAPETGEMTRIVFTVALDGVKNWPELTADTGEVEAKTDSREIVWTGTAGSVAFSVGEPIAEAAQPGMLKFEKVSITATGDLGFTSSPVVSPVGGKYSDSVTITITANEGADIYYTTDGTTPTEASTKYTEPFSITKSCTLKAIAIEEGKTPSNVIEQAYQIMRGIDITTLRTFLDDNPSWNDSSNPNEIYNFKGEYSVVYQNGPTLYIADATAGLMIGGQLGIKYQPGDIITGFRGTFRGTNGVPQLVPEISSMGEPVRHTEYEWTPGTYADVTDRMNMSRPYVLKAVYYATNRGTEARVFGTASFSNDEEALIYNGFSTPSLYNPTISLPEDGWYNIYGFVSGYTKEEGLEMRFIPIVFDETEGIADVETAEVVAREYFDMSGRRLSAPAAGIQIVREQMADGTIRTIKTVR